MHDATPTTPTTETAADNARRAARIITVLDAHGREMSSPMVEDHAENVQMLLTDLMHFCDAEGIDLDDCLHLADMAYRNELEGPGPLPIPDPLIQP